MPKKTQDWLGVLCGVVLMVFAVGLFFMPIVAQIIGIAIVGTLGWSIAYFNWSVEIETAQDTEEEDA